MQIFATDIDEYAISAARAALVEALQARPDWAEGHVLLARASVQSDDGVSALTALKKPEQACKAYNELQAVYGAKLPASQKDAVAKARTTAKCDG